MAALTSSSAPQSSSAAALTSADKLSATSSSTAAVASDCQLSSTTTDVPLHVLDFAMDSLSEVSSPNNSPDKVVLKRKLKFAEDQLNSQRKRIKILLQSKRRLQKRNADLKNVIADLRKSDIMSSESLSVLHNSAGGVNDLIKRRSAKQLGFTQPLVYSPELRSFALTLHFYSPHAYRYVRKMFDTCLPHPRTIQKWLQIIDGRPGFTSEAFNALQARAAIRPDRKLVCALMMDEMAIRQQLEWDGNKFRGYIDMGTCLDDDSMPLAKEALTFMVVGVNDSFKVPVAIFSSMGWAELKGPILSISFCQNCMRLALL